MGKVHGEARGLDVARVEHEVRKLEKIEGTLEKFFSVRHGFRPCHGKAPQHIPRVTTFNDNADGKPSPSIACPVEAGAQDVLGVYGHRMGPSGLIGTATTSFGNGDGDESDSASSPVHRI